MKISGIVKGGDRMNKETIDLIFPAMIHLCGILHVRYFSDILEHYGGENYTRKQILAHLQQHLPDHCCLKDGFLYDADGFDTWEQWTYILERSDGKPIYLPPLDELSSYADPAYAEWTPAAQQLLLFLEETTQRGHLRPLLERASLDLRRNTSPQEVIQHLLAANILLPEAALPAFGSLFVQFYNHTRLYVNHGYTPEELKQLHFAKKIKVPSDQCH